MSDLQVHIIWKSIFPLVERQITRRQPRLMFSKIFVARCKEGPCADTPENSAYVPDQHFSNPDDLHDHKKLHLTYCSWFEARRIKRKDNTWGYRISFITSEDDPNIHDLSLHEWFRLQPPVVISNPEASDGLFDFTQAKKQLKNLESGLLMSKPDQKKPEYFLHFWGQKLWLHYSRFDLPQKPTSVRKCSPQNEPAA